MAKRTTIVGRSRIFDEVYQTVAITQNTTLNLIASITCKNGVKPFLVVYAQEMNTVGGIDYVTWHLYRNGAPLYPYHSHTNQLSSPYDNEELSSPIELEQGDRIEIYADLGAAGAGNFNAVGRLRVEYDSLEENV